jgi:hypothetical protein
LRKGWVETNLAKLNLVAYLEKVIYWYLDCGDHHIGFAGVKCKDCGLEYLLAFSSKRRHFYPS